MTESRKQPTLGEAVESYYARTTLSAAGLERLMKTRPVRTHWRWAIGGALASAAAVILLAFAFGYDGRRSAPPGEVATSISEPGIVAVQIHADWCARSPSVAPIFADLLTDYGNEPVLFVTLDITDDLRRGQAELLAESLGISLALGEPFESGMIKLIDRENNVLLASITGREDSAEFEIRLAEFLDASRSEPPEDGT